jgi:pilus assembly protein Flp/PilA
MKDKFIAYLKDDAGQTSTEYILLVAVVAAIVIKFKGAITKKLLGDNGDGNGGILGEALNTDAILRGLNDGN